MRRRARAAVAEGWTHVKMKVGGDPAADARRAALIRAEIGPERFLMMDANHVWDVEEAIARTRELAAFDPWWMEEPTSPDDVLGHARIAREVAPVRIATGEHAHDRVMFKQLMQADAIAVCQLDACRLGGVNEPGATSCPRRPGTASRCGPSRSRSSRSPPARRGGALSGRAIRPGASARGRARPR